MKIKNVWFTDDVYIKLNVYPHQEAILSIWCKTSYNQFLVRSEGLHERHMIWSKKIIVEEKKIHLLIYTTTTKKTH